MKNLSRPRRALATRTNSTKLSVVVPVFNELAVLPDCHARLRDILSKLDLSHEIVFVDDGSSDGSGDYLANLASTTPGIRLVRLSRNFGKEAAMTAGIEQTRGSAVIVLDADLQDPPELIPDMVAAWRQGADVVCMRRRSRAGETFAKRLSSFVFYRLLNRISDVDIPKDTGDFRLLSPKAVQALLQLPERCRYMKGLYAWIGMPTCMLDYDRAPRLAGTTKWNYWALLRLATEGITSFSIAPLRWATGLGLVAAAAGALFGCIIIVKTALYGDPVQGYPSLMAAVTFLGGVQLLTIGLLGEYVGKTYMESKQRPIYTIRDVVKISQPTALPRRRRFQLPCD
jgi:glycosyltransferase involved in cell wall biosynthesis